ncbi:hypothetical protein H112_02888 [Trichophyton rubrum D6]|uniref:Uncharacterized protein n=3 Tax=Trichophyton TaxID=5550 RepID=A0A080WHF1_TRIRC|nr:uncharacterized protein TERG_12297 [Trichophyton rubrum CBS 118892]EZF24582.1 hypothetical protein H100_02892 [Trichophyton rubrum MR850]EZF43615.1 hypothetical protein H102_02885 [Trichophyton rubrum CBS 100081]EZF54238.1 hypothetical protein H103_02899 [Trichophyton rubrum CBS 288.86]EZF64857.1 hypothetical protein H104_02878 [Trichophyton rubrum CBS 289.86]EZF75483.1 hypothetical protein H105_02906 [Trichophyton soudanense CBS 452.61]EZF86150.1 hypothetical protein H110_02900 [Trichophy
MRDLGEVAGNDVEGLEVFFLAVAERVGSWGPEELEKLIQDQRGDFNNTERVSGSIRLSNGVKFVPICNLERLRRQIQGGGRDQGGLEVGGYVTSEGRQMVFQQNFKDPLKFPVARWLLTLDPDIDRVAVQSDACLRDQREVVCPKNHGVTTRTIGRSQGESLGELESVKAQSFALFDVGILDLLDLGIWWRNRMAFAIYHINALVQTTSKSHTGD